MQVKQLSTISMKKNLYILTLLLMFVSCKHEDSGQAGFYYNTENFNTQNNKTATTHAQRVFIRLMDMDDNGMGPEYHACLKSFNQGANKQGFIPVITVSNRSFVAKTTAHREMMVLKSEDMLEHLCRQFSIRYNEIYVDCDWTPGTKNNYFAFLRSLHKISDKKISCAVRLRQLNNPGFYGIPPVGRVTIICCPDIIKKEKEVAEKVPDYRSLKQYMTAINNYPLKTDLALPINRIIINNSENKQQTYYIYGITPEEKDTLLHLEHTKDERCFTVKKDMVFHGIVLQKGSSVKIDRLNQEELRPAKEFLANQIKKDYNLIYYGVDQDVFSDRNQRNLN